MSNLPDLDTSSVSFIAYYNIVDDGDLTGDFDISEITSSGRVNDYTLYDNGLEGTYTGINNGTVYFRGKDDGWLIAWKDRSKTTEQNVGNPPYGSYDLVAKWREPNPQEHQYNQRYPVNDLQNNTLERCINDLQSQLSVSDGIAYSAADVGLYDYRHQDASTVTQLSYSEAGSTDSIASPLEKGLTFTDGTDIYEHDVLAFAWGGNSGDNPQLIMDYEGTTLADASGGDNIRYGTIDALFQNLTTGTGTEYIGTITTNNQQYAYASFALTSLAVWG